MKIKSEVLDAYLPKLKQKCLVEVCNGPFYTKVCAKDLNGNEIGYEKFSQFQDRFHGDYIEVSHRQRRSGLGTLIHLTTIKNFLESGAKAFNIESMPHAKEFHKQFGLKPVEKRFDFKKAYNTLQADNRTIYRSMREKAEKLMADNKIEECEKLVNEYMQCLIKDCSQAYELTPMQLTREEILENKDFYNKLFKTYGINYSV